MEKMFKIMDKMATNAMLLRDVQWVLKNNAPVLHDVKIVSDSVLLFLFDEDVTHVVGTEGIRHDTFVTVTFPTRHASRRVLAAMVTGTLEDLIRGAVRAKATFPQEMWDEWHFMDEDEF